MADEKENMKGFRQTLVIAIVVIILAIIGAFVIHKFAIPNSVRLTDANLTIVLSFIGVLATFIVIGNFAQVSEIRQNMDRDLTKAKTDIENACSKVNTLKINLDTQNADLRKAEKKLDKLERYTYKQVDDLAITIEEQSDYDRLFAKEKIETESDILLNKINSYKQIVFDSFVGSFENPEELLRLFKKLSDATTETTFIVSSTVSQKVPITTTMRITNNIIEFYNGETSIDEKKIKLIDGVKINPKALQVLYRMYIDVTAIRNQEQFSPTEVLSQDIDQDETEDNYNAKKE